jgi:hypothetical protein
MSKEFYTEKDIEDLFRRGIKSLQVTENVVLTELAYEKAQRLNLQLITDQAENPPAAPVRPYLSDPLTRPPARATPTVAPVSTAATALPIPPETTAVENRIRSAVIARLGNQVDAKLLDNIIHRVVKGMGLK